MNPFGVHFIALPSHPGAGAGRLTLSPPNCPHYQFNDDDGDLSVQPHHHFRTPAERPSIRPPLAILTAQLSPVVRPGTNGRVDAAPP